MNTGNNPLAQESSEKEGRQRINSFEQVINHLPARTKDNVLLLSLFLLGISGFAYILLVPVGENANKRSLFHKIFKPIHKNALTSNSLESNLLKINGKPKVHSPMVFNFNKLSSCDGYKMDFGDKIFEEVTSHQFVHTYTEPGTYKVELLKAGVEKDIVVHCEFLTIH